MRIGLLVVLLLAPPLAAAGPTDAELSVEPLAKLQPLQGPQTTNVTFRVPCLDAAGKNAKVELSAKGPAWSTVIVSPAITTLEGETCGADGKVGGHALVSVTATDQAPADKPDKLVVSLVATGVGGTVRAQNETALVAGWFPLLDSQLAQSVFVMAPGGALVVPWKLTNLGNGATVVTASWTNQTLLRAEVPSVTLESKQQGGAAVSAELPITLRTPPQSGLVNHVDVVTINYTGSYAKDPTLEAQRGSISLVVTTRSADLEKLAPAPPLPLALGAIVLLALARRLSAA